MKVVIRAQGLYGQVEATAITVNDEGIYFNNSKKTLIPKENIDAIMVICGNHKEVTLKELADLFKSKEYIFSFCAIEIILKD